MPARVATLRLLQGLGGVSPAARDPTRVASHSLGAISAPLATFRRLGRSIASSAFLVNSLQLQIHLRALLALRAGLHAMLVSLNAGPALPANSPEALQLHVRLVRPDK